MNLPEPPRRDLAGPPEAGPPEAGPPEAGPPEAGPNKAGPAIALVGGALVLLGSFMPWASVTTVFGNVNVNGTDGDGKVSLVIGLVLVVLSILELTGSLGRNDRVLLLVFAFLAAGMGVYEIVNVNEKIGDVTSQYARASVGVGLYAVTGGGVLAVVGGFLRR